MDDLESAVFLAVYQSRQQRLARLLATALLSIKHAIRGILFSWPLYLLALLPLALEDLAGWWVVVFLLPAVIISGYILGKGIREDYSEKIAGSILKRQHFRNLFW